jgi:molybdopterin-guanine dinucleotide biosynthesis protein MobB
MFVAAVVGPSGTGKTTLIRELIRRFVAEGQSVGAIKHTHHPLTEERRGDTKRFADAGADPVVFAGNGEAVVFERDAARRITFASPRDLLAQFATDIVIVEGFKHYDGWPRIDTPIDLAEALVTLRAFWAKT